MLLPGCTAELSDASVLGSETGEGLEFGWTVGWDLGGGGPMGTFGFAEAGSSRVRISDGESVAVAEIRGGGGPMDEIGST